MFSVVAKTYDCCFLVLAFVLAGIATAAAQPVTVEFWHSMTGARLEVLNKVVADFNAN